ncbi:MAG: rRNA processing protein RimM [Flaviaesturariibacter sp.]|nr:rRNA processing protein RimM [Flaviaesturariibacter sp.]
MIESPFPPRGYLCRQIIRMTDQNKDGGDSLYYKVGKLVSAFGLKGELIMKHKLGKKTSLKGLAAIFVEERKGSFIPWFIESVRIKADDEVYLVLQDVITREAANKLTQKEVWLPEPDFKKFSSKTAPINLLGYAIIDGEKDLGPILEVIEQPHQLLCRLDIGGKEVLIPLHEETIRKIDRTKQQVFVELPEGLLDIYLK